MKPRIMTDAVQARMCTGVYVLCVSIALKTCLSAAHPRSLVRRVCLQDSVALVGFTCVFVPSCNCMRILDTSFGYFTPSLGHACFKLMVSARQRAHPGISPQPGR